MMDLGHMIFDGVDDNIRTANDIFTNSDFDDGLTFSTWVKFDAVDTNDFIVSIEGGYYLLLAGSDSKIDFTMDGSVVGSHGDTALVADRWYHIAGVYDGTDAVIYLDGVADGTQAQTRFDIDAVSNRPTAIGAQYTGTGDVLNGTVDDVQIYNRPLSAEQVAALYNNRTEIIVSNETQAGEIWFAQTTPNDGQNNTDGPTVQSNNVTILNTPPNITSAVLNATDGPLNRTTSNLTLNLVGNDVDNDPFKNITVWFKDGQSIQVLNMPFEGGSNSTFTRDYTPFGSNGTVINAVFNPSGGYDGFGAYEFGVNKRIDVASNTNFDLATTNFTISTWINSGREGIFSTIISRNDLPAQIGWSFSWNTPNNLRFVTRDGSGTAVDFTTGATFLSQGIWRHAAVTRKGDNYTIYLDGSAVGSVIDSDSWLDDTDGSLFISGRSNSGATNFWNGSIDDVQIFNRTLSSEQILAIYNNRTDLIVSQETQEGEIWSAQVTPNDGKNNTDGATVQSNNITIEGAPNITQIILNTTDAPLNQTIANLTLHLTGGDPNNDAFKNITVWFEGGQSQQLLNMPFEGGSNSTFTRDYTPFDNNGTVTNATFNPTGGFDGFGAYEFDGDGDFIQLNYSSLQRLLDNDASVSVRFTYRREGENFPTVIGNQEFAGNWSGWRLLVVHTTDLIQFCYAGNISATQQCVQSATNLTAVKNTNNFTHIVVTWQAATNNLKLYLNGQFSANKTGSENFVHNPDDPIFIGRPSQTTNDWNGTVDEVRLWNRTLSSEQVLALFKNRTDIIVNQETQTNETWFARVTPNDGLFDGATVQSNNITLFNTANVTFNNFSGSTTQFNLEINPENISDAILEDTQNGRILWNNPVNATPNQNFDTFVVIGDGFLSVDSSNLNPTFNSSSNISIFNVICPVSVISFAEGVHTTISTVQGNGTDCVAAGICTNVVCSGTTLNFTVSRFTAFAAGGDANLTIDNNGPKEIDEIINFTATYINSTSGALISGATCNINFGEGGQGMTETATTYIFNRSFVGNGTFNHNVTCSQTGFITLTASDNATVKPEIIPLTGGRGGGGGAGSLEGARGPECGDSKDNDGDGWIDLADPDCLDLFDKSESPDQLPEIEEPLYLFKDLFDGVVEEFIEEIPEEIMPHIEIPRPIVEKDIPRSYTLITFILTMLIVSLASVSIFQGMTEKRIFRINLRLPKKFKKIKSLRARIRAERQRREGWKRLIRKRRKEQLRKQIEEKRLQEQTEKERRLRLQEERIRNKREEEEKRLREQQIEDEKNEKEKARLIDIRQQKEEEGLQKRIQRGEEEKLKEDRHSLASLDNQIYKQLGKIRKIRTKIDKTKEEEENSEHSLSELDSQLSKDLHKMRKLRSKLRKK